ncbi:MAG: LuxR C-terminal-related transcriptional regulator [Trebonia sp.]|jgi:non-specific serine/threonine protein kinase
MLIGNATERQEQLPSEASDFIGRAAELRRVQSLLRDNRLVTLVGPGGVGKTRVALRTADQVQTGYPDGVCLVRLSALRDPELLPHTVASALELPEQSGGSQLDAVLTHLRDRRLLLILDTCEHIIDAAAIFAEAVITEAPKVTVLVTSREPLDVTGESCYTLPALGLPDDDSPGQGRGDAIELFALRAAGVVPGFAVTDENRADVIRLCTRLDGMPLAIELAAVQLRELPLKGLADRLERRIDRGIALLTGGGEDSDGRHRTLRDAIGWSYDLCTPAERALWSRLSVFAGSFGVDAVEEVCASGELSRDQIFDTVVRLVDKSVITRDDSASGEDSGQPTRYKMLDTIREFGAERLAASGGVADVRNRFIARYLSMARYFGQHVVDDDQLDRLRELRREHANLRAALEYTLDATESESRRYADGAELAVALYGYWHMSGLLREGKYWLDKALDRFPDRTSAERGWALVVRGYLGAMQGEANEAVRDATAGTEIGLARGDLPLVARGYTYLTLALTIADRYDEARAAGAHAEQPLQTLNDRAGLRILDVHLAHVANLTGDVEGALHYARQVTDRFGETSETGDSGQAAEIKERWAQGWAWTIAAMAQFRDASRDEQTAQAARKALLAKHELYDVLGMAYCLEIHGWLADRANRHRRAAWLLGAADPLWERAGGRLGGTAGLLQVHEDAMGKTRAGLGAKRFDSVFTEAGKHPLEQMVQFAVSDDDEPATDGARWRVPGQLTCREAEIADLAARGMSNRQIAEHLFISKRTVDAHLDHIYAKLGISSRIELLNALQWAGLGRA